MAMTFGLVLHISAGTIGLLSGGTALFTRKGEATHRLAGKMFFSSMIVMSILGFYLAYAYPVYITMLAGGLALYLVISSWLTVRRSEGTTGWSELATLLFGLMVTVFGLILSWRALNGITDSLGAFSVPAPIYYIFTAIAILGVVTDIIVYFRGGISGKHRIMRHLWRMCVPLYIAASSFFAGQQQVFPEALHDTFYLLIPQFSVLVLMVFWLVKIWLDRPLKVKNT